MPTGAGKTGVIAVLASCESKKGVVLVISPSKPLVQQLVGDISSRFFGIIGRPDLAPDRVQTLLLAERDQIVTRLHESSMEMVLVGTFQALTQIRREDQDFYEQLQKYTTLTLVDEGHREPASEWANAIRDLRRPTILFSATPFRNDLKLFDISTEHVSYLSFEEAVTASVIRPVVFRDSDQAGDTASFASEVVRLYDQLRDNGELESDARVIVE